MFGNRTRVQQLVSILKGPFVFEQSRQDVWTWPYSSTTVHDSAGYYQNWWWGNQLPNQQMTVWNAGPRQTAGNHKMWAPQTAWQISQLPYGQWQNQPGMSQGATAALLQKMSAAWSSLYPGG